MAGPELPPSQARGLILDVGSEKQPFLQVTRASEQITKESIARTPRLLLAIPRPRRPTFAASIGLSVGRHCADLILSTETLEHVPDPSVFLDEAFRCLRPGGHLLLTVPFAARWHYIPPGFLAIHSLWPEPPLAQFRFHRGCSLRPGKCPDGCLLQDPGDFDLAGHASVPVPWKRAMARVLGVVSFPLAFLIALVGQLSLLFEGGDDCLGYTAIALRPAQGGSA